MQMELKTKVWTTSPASLELWLFLAKPVVEGSRVCNDRRLWAAYYSSHRRPASMVSLR